MFGLSLSVSACKDLKPSECLRLGGSPHGPDSICSTTTSAGSCGVTTEHGVCCVDGDCLAEADACLENFADQCDYSDGDPDPDVPVDPHCAEEECETYDLESNGGDVNYWTSCDGEPCGIIEQLYTSTYTFGGVAYTMTPCDGGRCYTCVDCSGPDTDCTGECFGSASEDECGICNG